MSSSANSFIYSRPFAMQAALGIYAPRRADSYAAADDVADIYNEDTDEYEELKEHKNDDRRAEDGSTAARADNTPKTGEEGTDAGSNTLRPKV